MCMMVAWCSPSATVFWRVTHGLRPLGERTATMQERRRDEVSPPDACHKKGVALKYLFPHDEGSFQYGLG